MGSRRGIAQVVFLDRMKGRISKGGEEREAETRTCW
jgi:hypothetical protein